jgi:CRP-like cAMP-binding protein
VSATYENIMKEKDVFLENDPPNDKCYVIISGRIGIYRGKVQCDINIGNAGKIKRQTTSVFPSFKDEIYQGENIKTLKKLSYYGDMIFKMGFGRIFGQTGLLNNNPRNATIVTLEDCEFMVFHKSALNGIKAFYDKELNDRKLYLLKMIPEFEMINDQKRILKLIEFFKPHRYQHGQYLTNEGAYENKIYFLQEGELTLYKKVALPEIVNNRTVRYSDQLIPFSNVSGHAIVGEEILDADFRSKYTIQVKSAEVKALVFEKTSNLEDFTSFPLFDILSQGFMSKE